MKRPLLTAAAALTFIFAGIVASSAQTAVFSYNDGVGVPDAGTYTAGSSFTFSITLAFTAGGNVANLEGLSYWFEQQSLSAPFNFAITLRDVSGSQFTFLQTPGLTYPQNMTPTNANDLGAGTASGTGLGNGSYFIANLSISIAASAANGTYIIENTTTAAGKASVISDDLGHTFAIPQATYTITIIPEPGSLALLTAGIALLSVVGFRRRRISND